jgi:hypothetical protein
MPDSDPLEKFFTGQLPKNVCLLAARGLIPLPPHEMLRLLVRLNRDPDPEVAQKAAETLAGWPEKDLLIQLQSPECSSEVFEYYAGSTSAAVQEAIITNLAAGGTVVAALAARAGTALLETILYNRMRLLEFPEILQNLKLNPSATPQILGTVREIEAEFFGSKKRQYTVGPSEEEAPAREEMIEFETDLPLDDLMLEGLPLDPQQREAAILTQLSRMTVSQKMVLALKGTREMRSVLIRDTNRQVTQGVLQSPKLTISEVETFAAMRSISDDVIRQIGNSKEWTRSYVVVQNLVKNPKTPPMISQRLMFRLQARDLMMLTRDRGIPEAVRRNAQRLLNQRNSSPSRGKS